MRTHLPPARAGGATAPNAAGEDPHRSLHSQTGPRPGEHPGRPGNPLVKAAGLAWLEFEKPDLDRAGRFGTDFGFPSPTARRTRCCCAPGKRVRRAW